MSLSPAIIDAMLEAGCTAEQLAAVVKADLAERQAQLAAKRKKDAERQRKCRAGHDASRDVTVTVCDIADSPSLSLPLPSPHTPQPTPTHTHPDNNTRARKGPAKPEGVTDQTWADFCALRKAKRAALTETAMAGIEREARKAGWTMEAALAECVTRGWQAFKADWVGRVTPNAPPGGNSVAAAFLARHAT